MARPRRKHAVESERSEEAQTIRALALYPLRLAEPPIPGVTGETTPAEARRICERHRDHPAAETYLWRFEQADKAERG